MKDLANPPGGPVEWKCKAVDGRSEKLEAQSWYEARKEAAKRLGVSPDEVMCEMRELFNGP